MPLQPHDELVLGEIARLTRGDSDAGEQSVARPILRDAAGLVIEHSTHGIDEHPGEFAGDMPFGD